MPLAKNPGPLLTSKILGSVDNFPKEFLASVGIVRTDRNFPVSNPYEVGDVDADPLLGLLIESRIIQEHTHERKKSNTSLTESPEGSLESEVYLTETGQTGTKIHSLVPEGTPLPVDDLTESGDQHNLGNGWLDQTVVQAPELFPELVSGIEAADVFPEIFKAVFPLFTHSELEDGDIDDPPTLLTDELSRVEKQETIWHKRVQTSKRTIPVPQTKTALRRFGGEQFGGEVTEMVAFLNSTEPPVEVGLDVVSSDVRDLGNGKFVRQTEKLDVATEWPELEGQEYDESLDVVVPYIEQTILQGTEIGTPGTDIKPSDKFHAKKRTIDSTAAATVLDAYVMSYPSTVGVTMPDKLVGLSSQVQFQTGDGADSETGDYTLTGTGGHSVSLELRADATASATAIPEVFADIKQFYAPNVDCTHYIFFLPNPVDSADVLTKIGTIVSPAAISAWPKFNPQVLTILIVGANSALKVNAVSKGSYSEDAGASTTSSTTGGGTGYSRSKGLTLRRMQISPTIHGALTVTGTTTDDIDLNADADAEAVGLGPAETVTQTDTITAFVTPTSYSATTGATDWPSTGLFLYKVDARPYKYGYVMFHAIVVDAADFPCN